MNSLWQNSEGLIYFLYSIFSSEDPASISIIIVSDSDSYFLGMIMLISLIGTLVQTFRVQTNQNGTRVILPRKGIVRGQYIFFMTKYCNFYRQFLVQLLLLELSLLFS